jgi:hypothetical protein
VEQQQREMQSACIFIGEVIEINDDLTYKIRVVESLDGGDIQDNIYIGQNWKTCYPYVEENGFWLFYGDIVDGFFKVNICGLSRPFSNPFAPMSDSEEVKQLGRKLDTENLGEKEANVIFEKMQLMDLANEIKALRRRRDSYLRPNKIN